MQVTSAHSRLFRRPVQAGFTLVELLVVIGIIAVLISILLPALSKATAAAKNIQCMSNLKELFMAVSFYADDNRGAFPADRGGAYQWAVPRKLGGDQGTTTKYVMNTKIWACPEDATDLQTASASAGNYSNQQLGTVVNMSYAYHNTCGMLDTESSRDPVTNNYPCFPVYKPSKSPLRTADVIFFDAEAGTDNTTAFMWNFMWGRLYYSLGSYNASTGWSNTGSQQMFGGRHNGCINVVAGDGHCDSIDLNWTRAHAPAGTNGQIRAALRLQGWEPYSGNPKGQVEYR